MPAIPAYHPVVKTTAGPYSGVALVGSHSISVGWDVDPAQRAGLKGFAVRRSKYDLVSGDLLKVEFLEGQKRFPGQPNDGLDISSRDAPFQRFRWSDYGLDPKYGYRFEIFPIRGVPGALTANEPPVVLTLRPAPHEANGIGAYVNRGVTSAFAYLDRFKGLPPAEVPDGAAYRWLSRGLKEALLAFIGQAVGGEGLRVCIYEFFDAEVADALAAARQRGVDVRIVYHAKPGDGATAESAHLLAAKGLAAVARPRAHVANISHNKFVVLLDPGGSPVRLFTGTCNFSENAFNYQTNAAVTVQDAAMAAAYLTYWTILEGDPASGTSKTDPAEARNRVAAHVAQLDAAGPGLLGRQFFSPVRALDMIDCAVGLVRQAQSCIFTSAPFALDKAIVDAIGAQPKRIVHYGLANTTARKKVEGLTTDNTRFVTPSRLESYMGRKWDAKAFGAHKVHTKLMIIDPFGTSPQMLFGSANFSDESCQKNDENAFLTSDPRLIAIMATEFLRMFDHYKSRDFINAMRKNGVQPADALDPTDGWMRTAFQPTARSHKFRDREVFVGR